MWSKRLFGKLLLVYLALLAALALLFLLAVGAWRRQFAGRANDLVDETALFWCLWGLAAAVLGVAFVLAYLAMIRIFQPLQDMTRAAQSMVAGGTERATLIRTSDEVGQLSRAFDEMQTRPVP
jgi:HAMP domain-containing protein